MRVAASQLERPGESVTVCEWQRISDPPISPMTLTRSGWCGAPVPLAALTTFFA